MCDENLNIIDEDWQKEQVFFCEYIDSEILELLNFINCDVAIEIYLHCKKGCDEYIASNIKNINQFEFMELLSNNNMQKVILSSKEVYCDKTATIRKLFLCFDTLIYKKYINIQKYISFAKPKSNSYLESVLKNFINEFEIGNLDPDDNTSYSLSYYPMAQKAGSDFINDISLILGALVEDIFRNTKEYVYPTNLLLYINDISLSKYEKSIANGQILICTNYSVDYDLLNVIFHETIHLGEVKKIRKLLEISKENMILVTEDECAIGFTFKSNLNKISKTNSILFKISGTLEWSAYLNDGTKSLQCLIHNNKNNFTYERKKIDKNSFTTYIKRHLESYDIDIMWNIVKSVIQNSQHGSMIVFTDNAKEESERLEKSSFKIRPLFLSEEIIKNITTIDGAILCDTKGICYSIGVILDGVQTSDKKENISNGARHNSAVRYLENKTKCIIVVTSEDGDVKIFP